MNANPHWGALGFLTKQPEPKAVFDQSMSAETRLAKARELPTNLEGYKTALELRCWLSKSKRGGAVLVEEMDAAYIANTIRMINDDRHPTLKRGTGSSIPSEWLLVLEDELEARRKAAEEAPF